MFIVKYYLGAAMLSFAAILLSNDIYFNVIFAWIGLSLSLVSLAYIFDLPWIFRKKN